MIGEQREPFFIRQTFDPEHTETEAAARAWFSDAAQEAMLMGGMRTRRTMEYGGLLIEVWDGHLPPDQGDPRWMFAPAQQEANDGGV